METDTLLARYAAGRRDFCGLRLHGIRLRDADLRDADFSDADVSDADFSGADLRGTDFSAANLREAALRKARVQLVWWPAPTEALLAYWGTLSDTLTAQCMAFDASCHPDPDAFVRWALHDGPCPYGPCLRVQRAVQFAVRRGVDPRVPVPRAYDLFMALLRECCSE